MCDLRHPAIVSRRWPLAGVASFLNRAPESFSLIRNRHVESRLDCFGLGCRRVLASLFVAFRGGPMGPSHEGRTLAYAKNAFGPLWLLFITAIKLWFSCKSSYYFIFFLYYAKPSDYFDGHHSDAAKKMDIIRFFFHTNIHTELIISFCCITLLFSILYRSVFSIIN